jgi:bifunctional DNA-binding transcriptional regulator/antitoxin component of YhaV-PrlF toxin-antitoxin module
VAKSSEPKPRSIDPQNRIVLPPEALRALGAGAGDFVTFEIEGSNVRLRKIRWVPDGR